MLPKIPYLTSTLIVMQRKKTWCFAHVSDLGKTCYSSTRFLCNFLQMSWVCLTCTFQQRNHLCMLHLNFQKLVGICNSLRPTKSLWNHCPKPNRECAILHLLWNLAPFWAFYNTHILTNSSYRVYPILFKLWMVHLKIFNRYFSSVPAPHRVRSPNCQHPNVARVARAPL